MAQILLKTSSFLFLIFLGFLLRRVGFFGPEDYKIPVKIVMNVTMPCAAIVSFSAYQPELSLLLTTLLGFGMNCFMLVVAYFTSRHAPRSLRAVWLNCVPSYNIGAFALPFVQSFLSPASLVGTCLFDTGSALMCNGTTFAISQNILEGTKGIHIKRIVKTLMTSVPFLTYLILLFFTLLSIQIPQPVVKFVTPMANANPFLAMFMIGLMLDIRIEKGLLKKILGILALRFSVAVPAAAVFYFCLPLPLEIRQALAIIVFAPVGMVSTALATKAGGNPAIAACVNSLSILVSILCIITLVLLFGVV